MRASREMVVPLNGGIYVSTHVHDAWGRRILYNVFPRLDPYAHALSVQGAQPFSSTHYPYGAFDDLARLSPLLRFNVGRIGVCHVEPRILL